MAKGARKGTSGKGISRAKTLRRRSNRHRGLGTYILRIMKTSNFINKGKLSKQLAKVLTSFVSDHIKQIYQQCLILEKKVGKRTVRPTTVKYAIQLVYRDRTADSDNSGPNSMEVFMEQAAKNALKAYKRTSKEVLQQMEAEED